MDDSEDIFGEDVRDSSYLHIVSSDEEDLCLTKSPDQPVDKNNFPSNTSSTKSNYYEERFDRHFRLDKTLESDANLDTQNIIDEINKIFERSQSQQEDKNEENSENLIQKGKKIIKKIKSRLSSISDGFLTPKQDDLKIPKQKKRTRVNTRVDYSHFFDYEDYMSSSSSFDSLINDDEEYDPTLHLGLKHKKSKNNKSNKGVRSNNKYSTNKRRRLASILTNLEENIAFDKFGFDNSVSNSAHCSLDDSEHTDNPSDIFCLKFVIMDQNKNLINDKRFESVFIKSNETLGNIAKKIGEMYNIKEEDFGKIKIIIDGECQDHNLEIGNPVLGVENSMQIDIKFPLNDENSIMSENPSRQKKVKKFKKRHRPIYFSTRTPFFTSLNNNNEFIEID